MTAIYIIWGVSYLITCGELFTAGKEMLVQGNWGMFFFSLCWWLVIAPIHAAFIVLEKIASLWET